MSTTATDEGTAFAGAETGATEAENEGELFDKTVYDGPLALPRVDGEDVDRIALRFSGTVFLDRSDEADVALIKSMQLGKELTLMVEGVCAKYIGGFTTDREGDLDVILLSRAVKVHSVYRPVE